MSQSNLWTEAQELVLLQECWCGTLCWEKCFAWNTAIYGWVWVLLWALLSGRQTQSNKINNIKQCLNIFEYIYIYITKYTNEFMTVSTRKNPSASPEITTPVVPTKSTPILIFALNSFSPMPLLSWRFQAGDAGWTILRLSVLLYSSQQLAKTNSGSLTEHISFERQATPYSMCSNSNICSVCFAWLHESYSAHSPVLFRPLRSGWEETILGISVTAVGGGEERQ